MVATVAPLQVDDIGEEEKPDAEETGDLSEEAVKEVPSPPVETPPVLQFETIVFAPPTDLVPAALVLFFPPPIDSPDTGAVGAVIELTPAPATGPAKESHEQAFQACRAQVAQALQDAVAEPPVVSLSPPEWPGLARALEGLRLAGRQRTTLLYLAGATDARLAEEACLSATEETVTSLAGEVLKNADEAKNKDGLGWVLERSAYRLLAGALAERTLAPHLAGLMAHHAGEVGRHASYIEEVIGGTQSLKALSSRLVEENLLFLEDNSPAARTRAHDWLRARDQAPAGYNPLASTKERRAALDRAEAARTEGESP